MAAAFFSFASDLGLECTFYANRRLLTQQTYDCFAGAGLEVGVRAAEFEDLVSGGNVQVCATDTVFSRYIRSGTPVHDSDIVFVDEAHIQKTTKLRRLLQLHTRARVIVIMTATPVGLSRMADRLFVSGTLQEYRDCKALVPVVFKHVSQPDLSKVKRRQDGEYLIGSERVRRYVQTIVGDVIESWERFNPDQRSTLLYAPDVAGSRWITDQFRKRGHAWAHVDATSAELDGKSISLTRSVWDDILGKFKDGLIKGISSRFKLREGVDIPHVYCGILATPIGSLTSFLQIVGRLMRYSEATPESVLALDHGGNYHRFGSPNVDQPWDEFWDLSPGAISQYHARSIQYGQADEPIVCPRCQTERRLGAICPTCGYQHTKSHRRILMANGELVDTDERITPIARVKMLNTTQQRWKKMFWGFRRHTNQTFEQMYSYFFHVNKYRPPRDLCFMPFRLSDWSRRVKDIQHERIRWPEESKEQGLFTK